MDLSGYSPRIRFEISKRGYTVKTVEGPEELERTLKLRFEVFYREFIGTSEDEGVDYDQFDLTCDHLVILHGETPVGTYRFRSSRFVDNYYTQTEFECSSFIQSPGVKLEMGRACIHSEHRTGTVMNLLFRGLAEYIKQTETNLLFGCSSIKCEDTQRVARLLKSLDMHGAISREWTVTPLENFVMDGLADIDIQEQEPLEEEEFHSLLPGLLSAYVKAGSKIVGYPAHDREFKCIDLFTVLPVENLMNIFRKKYMPEGSGML